MIDSHVHIDTRSTEDIEIIALAGVDAVISCAYEPYAVKSSEVLLNHFNKLLKCEKNRASENLLKLYLALGIHPQSICPNYESIFPELKKLLNDDSVVAIGEVGLEKGTNLELEVFISQLKLADELNKKVIIHTPRKNKEMILNKELELIHENISESLVLIDHINLETIEKVIDLPIKIGLSVQPAKLSVDDIVYLMDEYSADKFILNSDMSHKPSNPLAVPETVHKLRKKNFDYNEINKVAFLNAKKFFDLDIEKRNFI